MAKKPHIVMIIPRGEAVRNFLYSDTLPILSKNARVTILSVIHDERFRESFERYAKIIPLEIYPERRLVRYVRHLTHMAHFRWLWSGVARNKWETDDYNARTVSQKIKRLGEKFIYRLLAYRPVVEWLTRLENDATIRLRTTDHFHDLLRKLKPDLVFNTSHIHGPAARLPVRVAHDIGIPTAGFIFSWDNLTSRSRIVEPYDFYLVWHQSMRDQLLSQYPQLDPARVFVTGTPQFDFHFKAGTYMPRDELANYIGFDPHRPFVLYTTGIDRHFPEEHRVVETVIRILREIDVNQKPQLVVRAYVKGVSDEMLALQQRDDHDVFFPPMQWDKRWAMPTREDQRLYSTMLRECALGINPASTVSLELMLLRKPVINLGFDPPGSRLPHHLRWTRHTDEFDHYIPVTNSDAVMTARSEKDLETMIGCALQEPEKTTSKQPEFLSWMFGDTLDGKSGKRVAHCLLKLV